eukprot:gb/GECH01006886.1/.p1 GENE.gb/GECH01006886.1/~~gb/GECH01006886.1/.p1  ORF type:complete len:359 (+),score=20.25 gb/GECH01006886.1/:1-1077(+)
MTQITLRLPHTPSILPNERLILHYEGKDTCEELQYFGAPIFKDINNMFQNGIEYDGQMYVIDFHQRGDENYLNSMMGIGDTTDVSDWCAYCHHHRKKNDLHQKSEIRKRPPNTAIIPLLPIENYHWDSLHAKESIGRAVVGFLRNSCSTDINSLDSAMRFNNIHIDLTNSNLRVTGNDASKIFSLNFFEDVKPVVTGCANDYALLGGMDPDETHQFVDKWKENGEYYQLWAKVNRLFHIISSNRFISSTDKHWLENNLSDICRNIQTLFSSNANYIHILSAHCLSFLDIHSSIGIFLCQNIDSVNTVLRRTILSHTNNHRTNVNYIKQTFNIEYSEFWIMAIIYNDIHPKSHLRETIR